MSKIQFDVNVAKNIIIDVANDELPVQWNKVYLLHLSQSRSLSQCYINSKFYMLHNFIKGIIFMSYI